MACKPKRLLLLLLLPLTAPACLRQTCSAANYNTLSAKLSAKSNATTACGAPTAPMRTGGESITPAATETFDFEFKTTTIFSGVIGSGKTSFIEAMAIAKVHDEEQSARESRRTYRRPMSFDDIIVDETPKCDTEGTTTPTVTVTKNTPTAKNTITNPNTTSVETTTTNPITTSVETTTTNPITTPVETTTNNAITTPVETTNNDPITTSVETTTTNPITTSFETTTINPIITPVETTTNIRITTSVTTRVTNIIIDNAAAEEHDIWEDEEFDVTQDFSFSSDPAAQFEAKRAFYASLRDKPAPQQEAGPPSPTLLAALATRKCTSDQTTLLTPQEAEAAKANGIAQRNKSSSAAAAVTATCEASLRGMSKAERMAYFNSTVYAPADPATKTKKTKAEEKEEFEMEFAAAMAEVQAELAKQQKGNNSSSKATTINMRPSDDLRPGQEEDQQGSSSRPNTENTTEPTLPKALVEQATGYINYFSKRTAARANTSSDNTTASRIFVISSGGKYAALCELHKPMDSSQALLAELDSFLEQGKEMIAARLPPASA
uniref:Uncharacterized protein n=1 Tax=Tetradesmus obliquus TaxID=3088 RepID=A0A383WI11_TETOB|eukprot:jgi/Sobl393_1/16978/SZX76396.1